MGSSENLENLVRSGGLKVEPPERKECDGLMRSAIARLKDAQTTSLLAQLLESTAQLLIRVQEQMGEP
ncbi:hypothetical protein [Pseudomonas sp. YuFO8]|jgi:hypothetical protein|uniref:hypothetical protein n=1 Tax=Pseudomonas sp. YuFO8 TaxID=3095361 RepID=UPI002B24169C|nr:hypothetical protein [Pseudomonas sp. YuFO8]MEB2621920.1 hypothetical protein [Pseudomonas sp. YuFO8]